MALKTPRRVYICKLFVIFEIYPTAWIWKLHTDEVYLYYSLTSMRPFMQRVQGSFRAFSNVCTYIFLLLKMKREIGTSVKIIKRVKIFLNHHQSAIMLEEADKFHQLFFIKLHYFKQNPPRQALWEVCHDGNILMWKKYSTI